MSEPLFIADPGGMLPTGARRTVQSILADVDAHPTPASYARASRQLIAERDLLTPLRIAILSSYTVNTFVPYLAVEMAREGFAADVHIGAFHSVLQELLDPASATASFRPDVIIVAQLTEDVAPALAFDYLSSDVSTRDRISGGLVGGLTDAIRAYRERHPCTFLLHNFPLPDAPLLGLAEVMSDSAQTSAVRALNDLLVVAARSISDVFVVDFERVCATVGYAHWRDKRAWYLGRAPLGASVAPSLAREHARLARALKGTPRKCLVLDLDNTLWGGIVGEDGVAGIRIGEGYPGNIFLEFQRALLQLHQRGVLLALNSKNNEADVMEVFRTRSEMVLGWRHFAATRINWLDKAANMQAIADELNIGLSALVFFDDNPVERARIQQALPDVLTLDVPADPMQYLSVLQLHRPFDSLSFSDEDRRRGAIQEQQQARAKEAAASASMEDFLHGLEMKVAIRDINALDAARVVDLLRKTNQFNVTTRRHSAAELDVMLHDRSVGAFSLRATDRFGDHGLVAVALAKRDGAVVTLDSFLLSCRVIGRGVETALLAHVARWAREEGASRLMGEFIPTAKNAPASELFPRHGFEVVSSDAKHSAWCLDLDGTLPEWPAHITEADAGAPAGESLFVAGARE